jgi:DNA polymerase-3 subunit gamma/tau
VEQVSAEVQALRLLARAARGSMRDALSLTDQAIAFGSGQLTEATVRQMLGNVDRSYVFRLIEALALGDGKTVVETSEALRLNGLSAASTLEEMSTVLQRMAVLQTLGAIPAAAQDESDPEAADTARLAALMPMDETQLLYSICLHGRGDLGLAPDEYAALTMVLLRLLAFKPQGQAHSAVAEKKSLISPASTRIPVAAPVVPTPAPIVVVAAPVVKSVAPQPWEDAPALVPSSPPPQGQVLPVRSFESNRSAALVETAQTAPEIVAVSVRQLAPSRADVNVAQTSTALVPTEEGDFWHATVNALVAQEAINAMVRELALQSQLVARDTDQWILRVERESLNQPGTRDRLGAALQAAGYAVKLVVEVGRVSDSPAQRNKAQAEEKQLAAEKIIFDDPFVQSMMRDFGAKIVPGSIKPL